MHRQFYVILHYYNVYRKRISCLLQSVIWMFSQVMWKFLQLPGEVLLYLGHCRHKRVQSEPEVFFFPFCVSNVALKNLKSLFSKAMLSGF